MSLDQIGQKLKSAREAQNLSLAQVYDRIKIPTNNLDAIESGRGDDLPEPVYVAGFIKRYGDFLGLSGQSLADEYKKAGSAPVEARGLFSRGPAVQQMSAPVVYVNKSRVDNEAPSFTKTFFYPSLLLIAVLGVVCGLGAWYQSQMAAQQDPGVLALKESAARFNPGSMPTAPVGPGGVIQPTQVQPVQPAPVDNKIALTAANKVWVEVKAVSTGQSLFYGDMERGDRRDFQDPQGLRVRAGNGGSLSVDYQGKSESFGLPGKVTERVFAPATPAGTTATAAVDATGASAAVKPPVTTVNKWKPTKRMLSDGSSGQERRSRRLDEGTRDIPGVSSGGSVRSIDVPYRYNDGRLDNE